MIKNALRKSPKGLRYFYISLLIIVVDIATKFFVKADVLEFTTNFMSIHFKANTGFALGSFTEASSLLRIVFYSVFGIYTIIFLAIALYLLRYKKCFKLKMGLSFLASGIIGNTIDKVFYGYVVDFIQVHFGILDNYVFNVADIFLIIGAVLIPLSLSIEFNSIFREKEQRGQFFSNKSFQLKTITLFVIGLFFYALTLVTFSYALIETSGLDPNDFKEIFYGGFLFILIAHSLIFSFVIVLFTHRSSGPILAFKRYLLDIESGNDIEFKLREGDFHEVLIECANIAKNLKETKES